MGYEFKGSQFNIVTEIGESGAGYLFNTRSQALLEVPGHLMDIVRGLCNGEVPAGDSLIQKVYRDYLNEVLLPGGFAVKTSVNELEALRRGYYSSKEQVDQMSLTIAPTMMCNLGCGYCYAALTARGHMTLETQDALIGFVERECTHKAPKVVSLTWIGGEPTLCVPTMVDLTRRLKEVFDRYGVNFSGATIVTNGSLVDDEMAKTLSEDCMINGAQVTIDGKDHDIRRPWKNERKRELVSCLDRVIEGYLSLLRHVRSTSVRINVDKTNADPMELAAFTAMLESRGVPKQAIYLARIETCTEFSDVTDDSRLSPQQFAQSQLKWKDIQGVASELPGRTPLNCGLKQDRSFTIDPEGYLSKCWEYIGVESRRVGHVSSGAFSDGSCRDFDSYNPFENSNCRKCFMLPSCMGGCAAHAIEFGGQCERVCHEFKFEATQRVKIIAERMSSKADSEASQPAFCSVG